MQALTIPPCTLDASYESLRQNVRAFLKERLAGMPRSRRAQSWQGVDPEFSRSLGARGWIGMTFAKEYGGQGRSWMDRLSVTEEILRYGAPTALHWFSDRQVGRAILTSGTEEQKREWLPRICRGEAYICLGMSEPEAGSDLASLKTRAIEEADCFRIDGQKVWTTGRDRNYIYLLARTDPESQKHRGLSEFVFEANLPGITLRPLVTMAGEEEFNEVFFDNVRVPKKALIGKKNSGWYQIAAQLDYERSGIERLMGNYPLFVALVKHVKETGLGKDSHVREKIAQLEIEFQIGKLLAYWIATVLDEGRVPNWEAAMCKAYSTSFEKHLASLSIEVLGLYGQLRPGSKCVPIDGMSVFSYLNSKGYSLQGGTTEILKNIVAQRGLGLPRE